MLKSTSSKLILALLFIAQFMFAQEWDSIGFEVDLDAYVITAQYQPTHYKNALHKTDIVDKEVFEQRGSNQLDNALRILPQVRMSYDPIFGPQIQLRGIGASNVAILIDGVPVIGRLDGGLDLSQISLNNIERLEIIQGPVSNLYGNNAAGGAINLITKKSQLKKLEVNAVQQIESIGNQSTNLNVGYQLGKFRINGFGQYFNYDQYPSDSLRIRETVITEQGASYTRSKYPWNPKEQFGGGINLRYNPNENSSVLLKYNLSQETVSDLGPVKRAQFNPYAQDMFFTTKRKDLSLIANTKIGSRLFADLTVSYSQFDRLVENERYYFETDSFDTALYTSIPTEINSWYKRLNLAYQINDQLELITGLNLTMEDLNSANLKVEELNKEYPTFDEFALYSQLKYQPLEALQLALGGRWINHSIYDKEFTPSFQLLYKINNKIDLRASYANGYRSPSLKELFLEFIDINHFVLGNENLEPEISNDLQLNLSYTPIKNLVTQFSIYKTSIQNRIDLVEYEAAKYRYENIERYNVHGINGGFSYQLKGLSYNNNLSIGYLSTNIEDEDTPEFAQVFDMNHNLSYDVSQIPLSLNLNYRYQGAQPRYILLNNEIQLNEIEASNFLDFSINYQVLDNKINLILGAKNIFNKQTLGVFSTNSNGNHTTQEARLADPGRSYFARLAVQF